MQQIIGISLIIICIIQLLLNSYNNTRKRKLEILYKLRHYYQSLTHDSSEAYLGMCSSLSKLKVSMRDIPELLKQDPITNEFNNFWFYKNVHGSIKRIECINKAIKLLI